MQFRGDMYVGKGLDSYLLPSLSLGSIWPLGVLMLLAWFLVSAASIWQLYSFGTGMPWGDVSSDSQPSRLVTRLLCRFSRNPMLFGFGPFIVGVWFFCGSFTMAFILSVLLVALVSAWITKKEEPMLLKRFSKKYI